MAAANENSGTKREREDSTAAGQTPDPKRAAGASMTAPGNVVVGEGRTFRCRDCLSNERCICYQSRVRSMSEHIHVASVLRRLTLLIVGMCHHECERMRYLGRQNQLILKSL